MRNHLLRAEGREGRFDKLHIQNIFLLLFLLCYTFHCSITCKWIYPCATEVNHRMFSIGQLKTEILICLLESNILLSVYTLLYTDNFNECSVSFTPE